MADGPLGKIKHIVVLMLENRSFDNLLGWLYDPSNDPPFNREPPPNFDGVYGKNLSNPTMDGLLVPVGKGFDPTMPNPDPGEPYQDVYAQVYGQKTILAPCDVPPNPPTASNMLGFLYDYSFKTVSGAVSPNVIMNCFTPKTVPVLSSLVYYYGVCDHWFASIPTQTLCNRSYVHAGTSSGYVNNGGGDGILFVNNTPTIFNLLNDAGHPWKVYCASWTLTSLALLTQDKLWDDVLSDHFCPIHEFLKAAAKPGGLPDYSFIEPIYLDSLMWGAENDMHPESKDYQYFGPSNVEQGEKLLYTVYNALRQSPDWESTLLIVTFDEHGGCYDHVSPPTSANCDFAISPDDVVIPPTHTGGTGFKFDRLGVRVPALVISPFTAQGTISNKIYDHTSVLSTVVNCFSLPKGKLGKRQVKAPDVSEALNLDKARQDVPPIAPPPGWDPSFGAGLMSSTQALMHAKGKPISHLQHRIVVGAAHRMNASPAQILEASQIHSALEADAYIMKMEAEFHLRKAAGRLRSGL